MGARRNTTKLILHKLHIELMVDIYKMKAIDIVANFRPDQLHFILKSSMLCEQLYQHVLKLHLKFLELEEYLYCVVTQEFLRDYNK